MGVAATRVGISAIQWVSRRSILGTYGILTPHQGARESASVVSIPITRQSRDVMGGNSNYFAEQFALTEAGYTTVRLMQEFKAIESRDPGPWEESLTLTCASRNGAQVALTPA